MCTYVFLFLFSARTTMFVLLLIWQCRVWDKKACKRFKETETGQPHAVGESFGPSVKETVLCRKADVLKIFFHEQPREKNQHLLERRFWKYRKLLRGRRD